MSASSRPLRQPGLLVYIAGLGTSALALWVVNLLNDAGTNIMGWYVNGILPVGAVLVGVGSGVGYAVASRFLNVKLSKAFVTGMLTTALLDYFAAQYLTYTHMLEQAHVSESYYSFIQYLRDSCEQMSFHSRGSKDAGSPLGMAGYFFKLLEIGGYALGAMFPSLLVFNLPYCKRCQQYLVKHRTGVIHSSDAWSTVKKLKKNERIAAVQNAITAVGTHAQQIVESVQNASLQETEAIIGAMDQKPSKDAAAKITFTLKKCRSCDAHHLGLTLETWGADKKPATKPLPSIDKTDYIAATEPAEAATLA